MNCPNCKKELFSHSIDTYVSIEDHDMDVWVTCRSCEAVYIKTIRIEDFDKWGVVTPSGDIEKATP